MPLITQVVNHTQLKASVKLLTKPQGWWFNLMWLNLGFFKCYICSRDYSIKMKLIQEIREISRDFLAFRSSFNHLMQRQWPSDTLTRNHHINLFGEARTSVTNHHFHSSNFTDFNHCMGWNGAWISPPSSRRNGFISLCAVCTTEVILTGRLLVFLKVFWH